jgi:hypothetical protein
MGTSWSPEPLWLRSQDAWESGRQTEQLKKNEWFWEFRLKIFDWKNDSYNRKSKIQNRKLEDMMSLKPWYKVVTPREDLREGKPLDASEFAVHLDQVRDGRAPGDYQDPERFFEQTYMTHNLAGLAAEAVRRLSGEKTEKCAVFIGTEFDSITGRGGKEGIPLRKTPWGEIAFQLGGKDAFDVVAQHEDSFFCF